MGDLCKIKEVIYDEAACNGAIVSFENGTLIEGQESELDCNLYKNPKGNFVVAAATENIVYSGEINRAGALKTFLAFRNVKTNKIRLVHVDNVLLRPYIPSRSKLDSSFKTETSFQSGMALNKQFGSKRSKRRTEQIEKLQVNVDAIKDDLHQTIMSSKIDEKDLSIIPANIVSDYKPPINAEAESLEDVYPVNTLIPDIVLESFNEMAGQMLESSSTDIDTSPYIKLAIINLQSSSSSDKEETCKILLYADCIIKLINTPAKLIPTRNFVVCSYSQTASNYLLDNFTLKTAKTRTRPMSMRDKSICYLIVLSALANNYQVDLVEIGKSIKLGVKRLQELAKALAFTIPSNKNIAILKFPLPQVNLTSFKGKRKSR